MIWTWASFADKTPRILRKTFAYDAAANRNKREREQRAADQVFGMLPKGQGGELRALWEEFEQEQTPDAMFAAALDRFQPLFANYHTDGHTWKEGRVTEAQVYKRMAIIKEGCPGIWESVDRIIKNAIEKGQIIPS